MPRDILCPRSNLNTLITFKRGKLINLVSHNEYVKKFKAWETKHGFPEDVYATSESVKKEASKKEVT